MINTPLLYHKVHKLRDILVLSISMCCWHWPLTQGQHCTSHLTCPPSLRGEPVLCEDFIDYCPASGHVGSPLSLAVWCFCHDSRYGTSVELTLGGMFSLSLAVLVLTFCQIQHHCHQADCTHPHLCAYWYIIPYLSFLWTARRSSSVLDIGKHI